MMQLSVYKEHYKETIRLGVPIMLRQLGIIVVGFADNIMSGITVRPSWLPPRLSTTFSTSCSSRGWDFPMD